jgi:hypothetical protein
VTTETELSRLDLDESGPLRRVPPRLPAHRQADYDEEFDELTVLYDCFAAAVLSWPFKFGPQAGAGQVSDSDFSQYAILEHARHRFLALAEAVINADVDELMITRSRASIFDLAARSATGYLKFAGIMIEHVAKKPVAHPGQAVLLSKTPSRAGHREVDRSAVTMSAGLPMAGPQSQRNG